jgi:RHS repeat-associated protein
VAVLFNDASGAVMERYEYDVYGRAYVMSAGYGGRLYPWYGNPYLFTGQRQDYLDNNSLKLMYYRSRYYDTYTGRFLQRDPLGVNPAGSQSAQTPPSLCPGPTV